MGQIQPEVQALALQASGTSLPSPPLLLLLSPLSPDSPPFSPLASLSYSPESPQTQSLPYGFATATLGGTLQANTPCFAFPPPSPALTSPALTSPYSAGSLQSSSSASTAAFSPEPPAPSVLSVRVTAPLAARDPGLHRLLRALDQRLVELGPVRWTFFRDPVVRMTQLKHGRDEAKDLFEQALLLKQYRKLQSGQGAIIGLGVGQAERKQLRALEASVAWDLEKHFREFPHAVRKGNHPGSWFRGVKWASRTTLVVEGGSEVVGAWLVQDQGTGRDCKVPNKLYGDEVQAALEADSLRRAAVDAGNMHCRVLGRMNFPDDMHSVLAGMCSTQLAANSGVRAVQKDARPGGCPRPATP